ncbi:MAG: ribosomal protein L39E [Pirellulaceae bacterium]
MNRRERALLNTETGGAQPRMEVRSKSRVDAGRWWWRTPLWICVMEEHVVVFAAARRHYIQRFPIVDCQGSHYCHTTGELVIEAGEDLQFSRLAMSPTDGLRVLDALKGGVSIRS